MFGTILKEVSGYFDKTALITAFFPSLIFWGATLMLTVGQQMGWSAAIKQWDNWSGTVQGIALVAFFAWVTFWSFLTINFRPFIVRLYEGYWSEVNPVVVWIKERRRSYWKQCWDKLDRLYHQLEEQRGLFKHELQAWKKLEESLPNISEILSPDTSPINQEQEQSKKEVTNFLNTYNNSYFFQHLEKELLSDNLIHKKLNNIRHEAGLCWEKVLRCQSLAPNNEKDLWNQYRQELTNVTTRFLKLFQQKGTEVEERMERIDSQLSRYYPTERSEIMPTQLGNVLKASEMYAGERYHLDAVLIWPRLLPNLPKEFVESLSSAKVSLDLMVTLSAYILLFGLPLAVWLAFKASAMLSAILPVGLAILAFAFRLYLSLMLAIFTLALTLISQVPPVLKPFQPQLQVFLILATTVLLAARLTYYNAVQAAVYYGEQIKTAFDLYRWKALEGLNLQLPPNLTEEQKLWEQVCGFLYRKYPPDVNYYRYVKQTNTKDPTPESPHLVRLPVPATLLPAYRPIVANDIVEKEMPESQIPTDAVRQRDELTGRCPLQPLPANQPISRSMLVEKKYLTDTVAVGIQATPAITLGGRLKAGDIVDITLVPDGGAASSTSGTPIVWENILILDVRSVTALDNYSPVIIIALSKTQKMEFATASPQARWIIASKY